MKIGSPWHLAAVALLLKQVWWVQFVSNCIGFEWFLCLTRKSQGWELRTRFFSRILRILHLVSFACSLRGQVPQHLVLEVDSHKVKLTAQQRKQGHKELWKVDQHPCNGTMVWTSSWTSWSTTRCMWCTVLLCIKNSMPLKHSHFPQTLKWYLRSHILDILKA